MWEELNDVNITNTYGTNDFCVSGDYTLTAQWEYENGFNNYGGHDKDLVAVLMNMENHAARDCDNGEEPYDYHQTIADGSEQQQLQWQSADPSDGHAQRVFAVYDSMDGNRVHPTGDNYHLLPAVLDVDEGFCNVNTSIEKKRAGRPRGTKVKRSKTEPKLSRIWEFIRDLLLDSQYCPTYICWENYEEGRFRFVQSDKVAKLWGKFKRNERMNYEKFSRAMRYYYKTGVLLPVQGKRLVYKFGPKATGWHTNNPNFKYTF